MGPQPVLEAKPPFYIPGSYANWVVLAHPPLSKEYGCQGEVRTHKIAESSPTGEQFESYLWLGNCVNLGRPLTCLGLFPGVCRPYQWKSTHWAASPFSSSPFERAPRCFLQREVRWGAVSSSSQSSPVREGGARTGVGKVKSAFGVLQFNLISQYGREKPSWPSSDVMKPLALPCG